MLRGLIIACLVLALALACGKEPGAKSTSTPTTIPGAGVSSPVTPKNSLQPASPTPSDFVPVSTSTPESTPSLPSRDSPTPPPSSSLGARPHHHWLATLISSRPLGHHSSLLALCHRLPQALEVQHNTMMVFWLRFWTRLRSFSSARNLGSTPRPEKLKPLVMARPWPWLG